MPFVLKAGNTTGDKRLDRIPHYDDKSKQYSIRRFISSETLRNRNWTLNQFLDQGSEGACVGFGFSHELAATPQAVSGITKNTAQQLYWTAQRLDEWPGGSYAGSEEFYEGTSVLAGAKAAREAGYYTGYAWAFSEEEIALALSNRGPVVIGVNWYEGMYEPNSSGFIAPEGEIIGGHCALLRGFNYTESYYVLHNSWGKYWGVGGTAKISRESMEYLLYDMGEVCLPIRSSKLN